LQTATAWTATSVQLVRVYLKRGAGSEVLLGELASTSQPVTIRNLRPNTAYEVRLAAFAEAAGSTAIDSGDAGCVTTFTTGTATRLELAFKLKLRDRTYEGEAQTDLTLTEGAIEDASGTLELEKS
jgi:predicted anti-sigma-YlaC factor YlaD